MTLCQDRYPDCPVCHGKCERLATLRLYYRDMSIALCNACAEDGLTEEDDHDAQ